MKILARLGGALLLSTLASSVVASNSVAVKTNVGNLCTFSTTGNTVYGINPAALGDYVVGNVGLYCNYVGTTDVTMKIVGGTYLRSGVNRAHYLLKWELEPPASFYETPISANPASVTFTVMIQTHTTPNQIVSGDVIVRLDQLPTVPGAYSSTVEFNFAP